MCGCRPRGLPCTLQYNQLCWSLSGEHVGLSKNLSCLPCNTLQYIATGTHLSKPVLVWEGLNMHVLKKQVTHTLQWFPQYQPSRSLYGRLWPNKRESGEVTAGRSRCVSPRSPTRLAVCQHSTSGSSSGSFPLVFIFVFRPLSLTTDHQMSTGIQIWSILEEPQKS